jgi:hypothetical protein
VFTGAWLAPSPNDQGLLHDGAPNLLRALADGAIFTLALIALVGIVVFVLRRPWGGFATWTAAASGTASIAASLVLIAGWAVLWDVALVQESGRPAMPAAVRGAERTQAIAWSNEMIPIVLALRQPWIKARRLDVLLAQGRNSSRLRGKAAGEQRALTAVLRRIQSLRPSAVPRLRQVTQSLERVVILRITAFDTYLLALRDSAHGNVPSAHHHRDLRWLARGEALDRRARRLGPVVARRLYGLGRLFSGA